MDLGEAAHSGFSLSLSSRSVSSWLYPKTRFCVNVHTPVSLDALVLEPCPLGIFILSAMTWFCVNVHTPVSLDALVLEPCHLGFRP
jgi:hypothetical protein